MSAETALKSVVGPLVAGGCHNGINTSLSITKPYVVFHEISGVPVNTIHGTYGGKTRSRYQVDVFAETLEEAKGLAIGTIKTAINNSSLLEGELIFQMNGEYSGTDKTHQYITEYLIWSE